LAKLSKVKRFQDPGLAEFIYTVAATAPLSAKRHLPEKFYNKIKTEGAAKKFARTATDDQKKEFLSYFGFKTITLLSNHDSIWNPDLQSILRKYEADKKTTTLAEIINENIYLVSDKKTFDMLSRHADFIDTPLYKMHMEMLRVQKGQSGWGSRLESEDNELAKKKELAIVDYLKVMYSGVEDLLLCDRYFEISPIEFKALLFLFFHKNEYVDYDTIQKELHGFVSIKEARPIIRELLEGLYIQQHSDVRKKEFTITAKGVRSVMNFATRSITKLNNAA
jgi:hypothetical protein